MSDYYISQIYPSDKRANDEVDALLISEGIRRDANLDYTCGMYDDAHYRNRKLFWQHLTMFCRKP